MVGKHWPQTLIVAQVGGDPATNPSLQIEEPSGTGSPPTGIFFFLSELLF